MATEKDAQTTQHIAELEQSIYQIQETLKWRTEAETKFKESIIQIQDTIEAKKSEQRLRQNQLFDATSDERKEWLKECITNLQEIITHFEEGLKGRQNNLSEFEATFSQLEQDLASRKDTLAGLKQHQTS